MKQLKLLKNEPKAYGGCLLKSRKGRSRGRPLATKQSMHLVLRSSKAKGKWSFQRPENRRKISALLQKFAGRYGVRILSFANVGNHLHIQIQLTVRHGYKPFIRSITAAIAMAVTGVSRWTAKSGEKLRFWDYRPFTRVILGYRALLTLKDYIRVNQLEGAGLGREYAKMIVLGRYSSA